jgi:hypothetical protein
VEGKWVVVEISDTHVWVFIPSKIYVLVLRMRGRSFDYCHPSNIILSLRDDDKNEGTIGTVRCLTYKTSIQIDRCIFL